MIKINHFGSKIPEDWDFFVDPPNQILPLISASTTLRKHLTHATIPKRIIYGLIFSLIGVVLGLGFNSIVPTSFYTSEQQHLIPVITLAIIGFIIAIIISRFIHVCTYVGENGLASYLLTNNRNSIFKESIFQFENCVQLFSRYTSHYMNFVYQSSSYLFEWKDSENRIIFKIGGNYYGKNKGQPKDESDNYYFGIAAEKAWKDFITPHLLKEIDDKGSTTFTIDKSKNHGRVSFTFTKDDLSIEISRNKMNYCYDDILNIFLDQGILKIEIKDDISLLDKLSGKNRIWILAKEMPNFFPFIELFNSLSVVRHRELII